MTRFLYLCDTHLGSDGSGFQQQTSHPDRLADIVEILKNRIEEAGNIDFVLHGGDMVHDGSLEQIRQAVKIFHLPVPVYLCLGNHDLTAPDSLDHWLTAGSSFFVGGRPDFLIETEDCAIHVLPNHWGEKPYFWEDTHKPNLKVGQFAAFEGQYQSCEGRPQILQTHSPVFGLPPTQTGMSEAFHAPIPEFTQSILDHVRNHPDLLCVLGAHNHLNMNVRQEGVHFVTASALVEQPFEYKIFECDGNTLRMETVSLRDDLGLEFVPDPAKRFVQGDHGVRNLTAPRRPDCQFQPVVGRA